MDRIGFGGSCHWCTEAIFLSLKGVAKVDQGWIASDGDHNSLSEAVIVFFDEDLISLTTLIAIHLCTHSSTSNHGMRNKYRSAIYTINENQNKMANDELIALQQDYSKKIITKILPLKEFKSNEEQYLDYYFKDANKPFCKNIVDPKLRLLLNRFAKNVDQERLAHL